MKDVMGKGLDNNMNIAVRWIAVGSVVVAIAVILGAFGAHGLKGVLTETRMATYQTAVQYHFYHGLGVMIVGVVMMNLPNRKILRWTPLLLLLGVLFFSGSLYLITLFDLAWLGIVTPFGGLFFIAGWLLLSISLFTSKVEGASG